MNQVVRVLRTNFKFPKDIPNNIVYKVHMLYAVVILSCTFLFLLLIYAFISPPALGDVFKVILIFLSLCQIPTIIQLRRRKWDSVSYLLIYPLWISISYGAFISGGIYASVVMLYISPLILAIVLLNARSAAILTILTVLYLLILMLLETSGLVLFELNKSLQFRFIITTVVCISVVATLAYNKYKLHEVERKNRELYLEKEVSKIQNLYAQSLSHDLRTPLSVISSQTFLIQKRNERGLSSDGNLEKINNYVQKLTQIVDDFAQISELNSGTDVVLDDRQAVDLKTLIQEMIEACHVYNTEKNIQILFKNNCKNQSEIYADSNYLQQVFRHLIHNGIQYGKDKGTLTIELSKNLDEYCIAITDDGIGIASDQYEKIFEPFYRINEARTMDTYTGSGVGLAITRRIIQLHRGRITVESKLNKGSTFTIILPT